MPRTPRAPAHDRRRQRGNALIISLILLVILMLFGITAVRTGMVNLRIARNTQLGVEAQAAAQRILDTKLSTLDTFENFSTAGATFDNVDATGNGVTMYRVAFATPECVMIKSAPGYSYKPRESDPDIAKKETVWRLTATASDPTSGTGAGVTVTQGVKVRLNSSAVCN
jgi:hypothetical protein